MPGSLHFQYPAFGVPGGRTKHACTTWVSTLSGTWLPPIQVSFPGNSEAPAFTSTALLESWTATKQQHTGAGGARALASAGAPSCSSANRFALSARIR
jgi:hypothetical protein